MTDAQSHTEKMKIQQATHRKRVAAASRPGRGLVLVYTGDGKGKSSSAFGVIVRALGWDQSVGVVQFIKGKWKTGERQFFAKFDGQIDWHTMGEGFTWDTQDIDRDTATAGAAFNKAREMLESGDYDLIVLDEINIALRYDYSVRSGRNRGPGSPFGAHQRHPHGAQRETGHLRVRRSRQRNAPGQASLRRGHQGRTRHRLLVRIPVVTRRARKRSAEQSGFVVAKNDKPKR